jgi:uncharacterized membrane protein YfhO
MNPSQVQVPIFLPAIVPLILAGWAYVRLSRNVPFKRVVLVITFVLFGAALLMTLWAFTRGHLPWAVVAVPVIMLFMIYRSVTFCPSCGITERGKGFRPTTKCSSCGTQISSPASK